MKRAALLIGPAIAFVTLVVACAGGPGGNGAVVAVSVDTVDLQVHVGGTAQVSATVEVVGGANAGVAWSSEDDTVASVSASGLVTGVAVGVTHVIATSVADDTKSAAVHVTVIDETTDQPAPSTVTVTLDGDGGDIALGNEVSVTVPAFDGSARSFTLTRLDADATVGAGFAAGTTYELTADDEIDVPSIEIQFPVTSLSAGAIPVVTFMDAGGKRRVKPSVEDGHWVLEVPTSLVASTGAAHGADAPAVRALGGFDWRVAFGFTEVVPVVYALPNGTQVMGEARTNPCRSVATHEELACWIFLDDSGVPIDVDVVGVPNAILMLDRDDGSNVVFGFIADVGRQLLSTGLEAAGFAGTAGAAGVTLIGSVGQVTWQIEFALAAQSAVTRWFGQFNRNLTDFLTLSAKQLDLMSVGDEWGVRLTSSFVLTVPKFTTRCTYDFCNIVVVRVDDAFDAGGVQYRDVWVWVHETTSDQLFVLKESVDSIVDLVGEAMAVEANFCYSRPGSGVSTSCGNFDLRVVAVGLVDRGWWGLGRDRVVRLLVNTQDLEFGTVRTVNAPNIDLVGPTGEPPTFTWSVTDADGDLDWVEYRVDDGAWIDAGHTGSVTPFASAGEHTFEIAAGDEQGHLTMESRTFAVGAGDGTSIRIEPSESTVEPGDVHHLVAIVEGTNVDDIVWSATCGAIEGAGMAAVFTAPSSEAVCSITARSENHPTLTASASVTVEFPGDRVLRPGTNYSVAVSSEAPVLLAFDGAVGDVVSVSFRHPRQSQTTASLVVISPGGSRLYSGSTVAVNYPYASGRTSGPMELEESGRYSVWITSNGTIDVEVGFADVAEPTDVDVSGEFTVIEGVHDVLGDVQFFRIHVGGGNLLNFHHRRASGSGWTGELSLHRVSEDGSFHTQPVVRRIQNSSFLRDAEHHTLPMYFEEGGEYLLSVRADRLTSLSLGAWFIEVSRPPVATTPVPSMLSEHIDGGTSHFYTFDGTVGDTVSVTLTHPRRTSLTATLAVYDPAGERLYLGTTVARNVTNANVRSTGPMPITEGGRYAVWVTSNGTTDYTLSFEEIDDDDPEE